MDECNTVIISYTRAEAIEAGVLIDVTGIAKEAGFRLPVAVTSSVWAEYVTVPTGVEAQDESGRLWDVLWMLMVAIRTNRDDREIRFRLHVKNDNQDGVNPFIELKAVCGPDDDGTPCVTVMLLEED
jgi:hypothetical protein